MISFSLASIAKDGLATTVLEIGPEKPIVRLNGVSNQVKVQIIYANLESHGDGDGDLSRTSFPLDLSLKYIHAYVCM